MKNLFAVIILIYTVPLFSQQLSEAGHFIKNDEEALIYKLNFGSEGPIIEMDQLRLKGSSVFETATGYLTVSGSEENSTSTLRLYTMEGKETYARNFKQTINLTFSETKSYCAFHDGEQIHLLNISNTNLSNYQGSNVFAVNDYGQLAYYDDRDKTVYFDNKEVKIKEAVYGVLFYNNLPVYLTKKNLFVYDKSVLKSVFNVNEGRIFDADVINGKLFISVKTEKSGEFVFNSFSSSDLMIFKPEEEIEYPLNVEKVKVIDKLKNTKGYKGNMLPNEFIRNPLYFFSDTVYQAIGNTNNELQDYGSPYLHPGVDLMGYYLQDVRSVKNGYVKAILTTSGADHWRIAIANMDTPDLTQGYLYAHIEKTTFPYAIGDAVSEGDVVGKLVNFPVAGFVHCHFARIVGEGETWDGNWVTIDNPLVYMSNFFDSIPPQFEKTFFNDAFAFRNQNGNYLNADSLYGSVKVISKVHDRLNSEWKCDVNKISYNISPLDFPEIILLDSFSFDYGYTNDVYSNGSYHKTVLNTIYSKDDQCKSLSDYNFREYYHIITNSDGNDTITTNDANQVFNTLNLANGSYIFRVIASDPSGNISMDSMIIRIKNVITDVEDHEVEYQINISPNPFTSSLSIIYSGINSSFNYNIRDIMGKTILTNKTASLNETLNLEFLTNGTYFLDLVVNGKHTIKKIIKVN